MEPYEALDTAAGEFAKRLCAVRADHWSLPTPCDQFDVAALVAHVIGGNRLATALLRGATRDEAVAVFSSTVVGPKPVEDFNGAYRTMVDTLRKPGVLERTVDHPMGTIPARQLFNFRVADLGLHAWDLARAIGADEILAEALVAELWTQISPMKPIIATTGVFGAGPSGAVGPEAPLQTQLLDLTGRRP
jgi:uncharacterized protein (TIGR03086 family)